MTVKTGLLVALGVITAAFTVLWGLSPRAAGGRRPTAAELGIGFLTDFLDTLGIGSFAETTALYKLLRTSRACPQ